MLFNITYVIAFSEELVNVIKLKYTKWKISPYPKFDIIRFETKQNSKPMLKYMPNGLALMIVYELTKRYHNSTIYTLGFYDDL